MHFLLRLIAMFDAAIEAIHAMPRLQAVVKRDTAVVNREAAKLHKAEKASMKAYSAYRRAADKRDEQSRVLADAEWTLSLSVDKRTEAESAIAQAAAEAVHQRAVPMYDRIDVVLNKLKLDRIENILVYAKVGVAENSVGDWKEQVELMTEALANAPEGLVESANTNLCNAIRRMDAADAVLADMRKARDDYHEYLERRWIEKEEARIERKMRR